MSDYATSHATSDPADRTLEDNATYGVSVILQGSNDQLAKGREAIAVLIGLNKLGDGSGGLPLKSINGADLEPMHMSPITASIRREQSSGFLEYNGNLGLIPRHCHVNYNSIRNWNKSLRFMCILSDFKIVHKLTHRQTLQSPLAIYSDERTLPLPLDGGHRLGTKAVIAIYHDDTDVTKRLNN
ncbi:hypothetical protein HDU87_007876 [Geranomyces variabilis]|uniref:Uncharacterized protein n=1 Tax=Geranomyces variabilis TaxID=109894 RepID=A0AAD5TD81_9FUNG|nr:hypothetical protein HDU87_007876 [Geranomyces variabilis]